MFPVIAAGVAYLMLPWAGMFPAPPAAFVTPPVPVWNAADGPRPLMVDTHADTTQRIVYQGASFLDGIPGAHLDLAKMRAGGLDAQFFSIFVVPARTPPSTYFSEAMKQIHGIQSLAAGSGGRLALARTARDVRDNAARGVPSALLGVEGGHALGPVSEAEQLQRLRQFAVEGVRYMTLTWTNSNPIGGSSGDEGDSVGLTAFGRRVIDEMERLGVLVDLSHVSDPLFWDAVRYARKPVLLSHSSSRALANVPRNVTDAMLRAVAKNGGAVCVNYNPSFLDADYAKKQAPLWAVARGLPPEQMFRKVQELSAQLPPVPLARLADHIQHMVEVAGVDHICLGSDFDGIPSLPADLDDASHLPALVGELRRRGVSPADLRKILGENVLRVMDGRSPAPVAKK
ncbi:MAG TPA: dipeptidase [Burkholderiaceae bacterium]|nr:dipeptidase [Burkholderiaceae bacterium]